jgi:hypothetical protein
MAKVKYYYDQENQVYRKQKKEKRHSCLVLVLLHYLGSKFCYFIEHSYFDTSER